MMMPRMNAMQTQRPRLRVAHVVSLILMCAVLAACGPGPEPAAPQEPDPAPDPTSTSNSWLQGTTDERFETVTRHLRGLDMAMVEIGYRYQELYRAGQSENWDYATYQANKIRQSLQNALQRRPRRDASALEYFMPALAAMTDAVGAHDRSRFDAQFVTLTESCNRCHVAEAVPSFIVIPPEGRTPPIQ